MLSNFIFLLVPHSRLTRAIGFIIWAWFSYFIIRACTVKTLLLVFFVELSRVDAKGKSDRLVLVALVALRVAKKLIYQASRFFFLNLKTHLRKFDFDSSLDRYRSKINLFTSAQLTCNTVEQSLTKFG